MRTSTIGSIASSIKIAAVATPLINWITGSGTFTGNGTNTLTGTSGDSRMVACNPGDVVHSTKPLKTFETGADPSWAGHDIVVGLSSGDYGAGYASIEFGFYRNGANQLLYGVNGPVSGSLCPYQLPTTPTSVNKLRTRIVADTTFWRVFFEYSTDSGGTWTIINSGGTLSAIAKTTPMYGSINSLFNPMTINAIKGDA